MIVKLIELHSIDLFAAAFEFCRAHHCCFGEGFDAWEFIELVVAENANDPFERFEVFFSAFCPDPAIRKGNSGACEESGKKFFREQESSVVEEEVMERCCGICNEDVLEQLSAFEGDGFGITCSGLCFGIFKQVGKDILLNMAVEEGGGEKYAQSFHAGVAGKCGFFSVTGGIKLDMTAGGTLVGEMAAIFADYIQIAGFYLIEEKAKPW